MFVSIYLIASILLVADPIMWTYEFHAVSGSTPQSAGWSGHTELRLATAKRSYIGPFANTTVTLDPGRLPEHDTIVIMLTVYILGSWDGVVDGDRLTIILDEKDTLLNTTFSNTTYQQNYPFAAGGRRVAARTGATETDVTGWMFTEPNVYNGPLDAAYVLTFRRPHDREVCSLRISGVLRDVRPLPANEAWGVDDVHVGVIQRRRAPSPPDEPVVVPGR
jgi:hypothetical protein